VLKIEVEHHLNNDGAADSTLLTSANSAEKEKGTDHNSIDASSGRGLYSRAVLGDIRKKRGRNFTRHAAPGRGRTNSQKKGGEREDFSTELRARPGESTDLTLPREGEAQS